MKIIHLGRFLSVQTLLMGFVIILFSGAPIFAHPTLVQEKSQDYLTYKGHVIDSRSLTPLAYASLNVEGSNISTIANAEGEFLLKVPFSLRDANLIITFLGYQTKIVRLTDLNEENIKIPLIAIATELSEIKITAPKDALTLVKNALNKKGEHYSDEETVMTAFYRETIKKRRRNASLSEAIVEIHKASYATNKSDKIKLIKARKSTDYNRLDTLAVKLQGGPFSALYADMIKYPQYVFSESDLSNYEFAFDTPSEINDRHVLVVNFKPSPAVTTPLYYGTLYIDAESLSLISALYQLNVENKELAAKMFVRKKPNRVTVYPTEAAYRVNYRIKDGKWFYSYSNLQLIMKVIWKGKLFNSIYTLSSEMAITDWEKYSEEGYKKTDLLRPTMILSDEASGFSDPLFWGEYNIIEPEKSIESAIDKIKRQREKQKTLL